MPKITKIIATCLLICGAVNISVAQLSAVRVSHAEYKDYYRPETYIINQYLQKEGINLNSPTVQLWTALYPHIDSTVLYQVVKHVDQYLFLHQLKRGNYLPLAEQIEVGIVLDHKCLPSYRVYAETQYFYNAYVALTNMLEGKAPIDLKKAIFLVENAFNFGQLNYESYHAKINEMVRLCKLKIAQKKLDPDDNMVKNMMIFHFLSDTFKVRDPVTERLITHYPIRYDAEDFRGEKDLNSVFVTKLVASGIGQCTSMPLLYLILAQEIGAEAYLSYAPHHSFVKIKDRHDSWYNVELTCGYLLSDYHYMNNSFIKAEAIRNKLYLHPMELKEIIANLMTNLARFYIIKFGFDDFIKLCYETAMPCAPNSKMPMWLRLGYEQYFVEFIMNMCHYENFEIFKEKMPRLYDGLIVRGIQKTNEEMDRYGFEEMPAEIYEQWLQRIREKKNEYMLDGQINLRKTVQ